MTLFNIYERAYDILPGLLAALCHVESGHDSTAINVLDGGSPSIGKCQVKLTTARMFEPKLTGQDLFIAPINIRIAAKYLRKQYDRYQSWDKAVAAYNAGSIKPDGIIRNKRYVAKVNQAFETRFGKNQGRSTYLLAQGPRAKASRSLHHPSAPRGTREDRAQTRLGSGR